MSLALRRFVALLVAFGGAAAVVLVPAAAADPDIDTESAAAVIEQLQEEGYAVEVNGVSSGNTALLASCTVTQIHNPGGPTTDPTTTTTVHVDVACPISHG
jgi:hypothetical protein